MIKKVSYMVLGAAFLVSGAQATCEPAGVQAASAPVSACNFSGFYLGLSAGYGVTSANYQDMQISDAGNAESVKGGLADGFVGGIFAGYGKEFSSRFYAGLELAYLFQSAKGKVASAIVGGVPAPLVNQTTKLEKKDAIEAAIRLGFAMNNALPYIKLGYTNAKFKQDAMVPDVARAATSKRLSGFLVGAGIDLKLTPKMTFGLGYTYSMYNGWKKKYDTTDPADPDEYFQTNQKPRSHDFALRVAYTF